MAPSTHVDLAPDALSHEELVRRFKSQAERVAKLEELVEIISRGKYMWESTFDAITSPVQIVSRDYEIIRANLSLAAVGEKDIAAIIGRKCYEAFAGRTEPCENCPMAVALEHDRPSKADLGNHIARREFEANAYPLAGSGHGSAVVSYRDVTEERRLQREVIQQEKMAAIGMLAGGVAHEINNPLGGILAFAQLMKRDAEGNETLTADLDEVEKAAVRCKKIVADLLDFSRVSKDRERRLIDVNVLIEKVFPFIQREVRSMNIELVFDGAGDVPPVVGIPDRLQQVFLNLMTNAIHAMPKGGKLVVATRGADRGRAVEVHVRDTGVGIPRENRDKIFDPFFTTKEPGKGTGLGLSISYRIVKEHGGELSCEEAKGGGTEFTVRLPASSEPETIDGSAAT